MVDLKKLQKEIDNLLENETDDSLLNWYMSKKFPSYKSLFGEGEFYDPKLSSICIEVGQTQPNIPIQIEGISVTINYEYATAA